MSSSTTGTSDNANLSGSNLCECINAHCLAFFVIVVFCWFCFVFSKYFLLLCVRVKATSAVSPSVEPNPLSGSNKGVN